MTSLMARGSGGRSAGGRHPDQASGQPVAACEPLGEQAPPPAAAIWHSFGRTGLCTVPVAVKPAPTASGNGGTEPPAADRPMPRIQRRLLEALIRCVVPGPGPGRRRHQTGSPSYPTSDLVHGWDIAWLELHPCSQTRNRLWISLRHFLPGPCAVRDRQVPLGFQMRVLRPPSAIRVSD